MSKFQPGNASRTRGIIHLDMDAFYASVEILDNPALKGQPVIVGGSSRRGVVSAASYAARRFGIHSAMPIMSAQRLCPQGHFLPVRMERYQEISEQIFAIYQRFTPLVEPLSLDEAFLDVTSSISMSGPPEHIARIIKELVRAETGLTVSAGVAPSKLVAKIASDFEKPDGLTVVGRGEEKEFLSPLPIERLWGVGRATRKTLRLLGVRTIGDLSRLPVELLERKFGRHGIEMHRAARGIDDRKVEPQREMKSLGNEETFTDDLTDREAIRRELLALAVKVGRRMRRHHAGGKTVTLKIKYNDFKQITRSTTLKTPTSDSRTIFQLGCRLLDKTEAGGKPIRLLGLALSNLTNDRAGTRQGLLFPVGDGREKRSQLNEALDRITDKFGPASIQPGTLVKEKPSRRR